MNRESPLSILLLFAFLISIVLLAILPVFGLQSGIGISSYGTINYSTTGLSLHVDGKYLKDQSGNIVMLRGVNLDSGQWWDSDDAYTEQQFVYMHDWGCNAVRITVQCYSVAPNYSMSGSCLDDSNFWKRLDNLVNWAEAHGLYVILCGWMAGGPNCEHGIWYHDVDHLFNSGLHLSWNDWFNAWIQYAQRYKNKSHVIYDLYNEPLHWNLADHQAKMRRCIDNIRSYGNPNAVCMVECVSPADWEGWGFDFEQSYPISRSNVIYSFHSYGYHFSDNSKAAIRSRLATGGDYQYCANWMLANGRCVQAGEFGPGRDGDWNAPWDAWQETWLQNFMEVCEEDGYSGFLAWQWVDYGLTCERLLADWNGNPSTYGRLIQEVLKG